MLGVLALVGLTGPASATAATTALATSPSLQNTPFDSLMMLLDLIYRLIGGDPQQLDDPRPSLTTRMNIVRGQYETYGIPDTLAPLERDELLVSILTTHQTLQDPLIPLVAGEKTVELLDQALRDMWDELGGEPGVLDP